MMGFSGISYYGGKKRISNWIVENIPPHTVYVEPFCGGASVLFKKGLPEYTGNGSYKEVINDHDERLITLWRQLQQNPELERRLKHTLYSRSEHKKALEIIRRSEFEKVDDLDLAWAMFVSLSMSYASQLNKGWTANTIGYNAVTVWKNKILSLESLRERMDSIYIECKNAFDIIQIWDSPQTCFYLDPPYVGTDQGHYSGFTMESYRKLLSLLDVIQGSFLLSCYATGEEPEHWKHLKKETFCTVNAKGKLSRDRDKSEVSSGLGDRKRTESLFIMDRSENVRDDLKLFLWSPSKGHYYANREKHVKLKLPVWNPL